MTSHIKCPRRIKSNKCFLLFQILETNKKATRHLKLGARQGRLRLHVSGGSGEWLSGGVPKERAANGEHVGEQILV